MSVDGTWQLVIDSPMGKQQATAVLQAEGEQLTGTVTNNGTSTDIFDGTVRGDEVAFKAKGAQFNMTLAFTTTVQGDTMAGKVKAGMFGSFPVSGSRG